jgi:heme/copper-type cytochrome/quinol oxidase subunit 3
MYGVVFSVYYLLASTHTTVHVLSGLLLLADGIVFGTLAYSREGKRLQK